MTMSRTIFAVCAVASLSAVANAVSCGTGTHLDLASDTCVITTVANQRNARAGNGGPSIDTEDGNIVISVDSDGKQVGYRIGDKTIMFDDMAEELRGYTAGSIGAINLGYKVGVVDGGSNAILDYLKTDLSDRVNDIKTKQEAVGEKVTTISSEVTAKMDAQNVKAAADLKRTSDTLTASVNKALEKQSTDTATANAALSKDVVTLKTQTAAIVKSITVMEKKNECENTGLVFNPLTVACCKKYEVYEDRKCVLRLFGTSENPATSCLQIFETHKYGASKNGYYQLKLAGNKVQAYCKFDGDYPGATLVARKQGRIGGEQQRTGRMRYPCKPSTSSGSYCKLSDDEINILRDTSKQKDAFVSLSYKNRNPNRPACRSFASKSCKWNMIGASSGCSHAHVRNSGAYCHRNQKHNSYRGLDGHTCGNLNYNSNNKFRAGDGGVAHAGNAFNIWEHSGGSHYCGGWDTTWRYIELWIH